MAVARGRVAYAITMAYGVTSYGSGYRKETVNWCLEFSRCLQISDVPAPRRFQITAGSKGGGGVLAKG